MHSVLTFKKFITNINMLKIFAFILFFGCSLGIPQLDVAPLEPESFEDKMEDALPEFEDFALATPDEERSVTLIGSIIAGVGGVCVFAGTKLFEADIARCNQVASDPDLGGLEWVKCMYGVFNKYKLGIKLTAAKYRRDPCCAMKSILTKYAVTEDKFNQLRTKMCADDNESKSCSWCQKSMGWHGYTWTEGM